MGEASASQSTSTGVQTSGNLNVGVPSPWLYILGAVALILAVVWFTKRKRK